MHNYGSAPLARQIDYVFRQLETELTHASAGTVLIHIRNNTVGKYGIRHNPIELKKPSSTLPLKGSHPLKSMNFARWRLKRSSTKKIGPMERLCTTSPFAKAPHPAGPQACFASRTTIWPAVHTGSSPSIPCPASLERPQRNSLVQFIQ